MRYAGSAAGRYRHRLVLVSILVALFMVAEAATGYLAGSLSLLADAGHMLSDVQGLGLALLALWWATRPAHAPHTYGHYRAEVLAALANGLALFGVAGYIIYEAYGRFQDPQTVDALPVLAVGGLGLLVNLSSMALLKDGSRDSLNIKGAYLHVLGDMLGSLGVIASVAIILAVGWLYADPLFSVLIALFLAVRTLPLLRDSLHVLLEGTPAHIDTVVMEKALRQVPGVVGVHDLHVWTITSGMDVVSAHVTVEAGNSHEVLEELQGALKGRFGLCHSTLQLEEQREEGATECVCTFLP
ncbi:MAG TPA: cation diffusion facilitator family transporter [Dehalococcoidia bacterium]|nr:cation diffusion facilitator family transporter [Dehalococcoidia bacterium]